MAFDVEEIALRSGTTADWTGGSAPVLDVGEVGLNLTTGEMKFGDGTTAWSSLRSVRGASGYATLVAGTKVVNEPSVTSTAVIQLSIQSLGTVSTPQAIGVTSRVNGTSFTITSAGGTDTSVIGYTIFQP